jgi:lysophospholipase L1-like esterase
MRKKLGSWFTVIEEGMNGRTTMFDDPEEAHRRGDEYLAPCLSSHRPLDLVIIMLGTNDLKNKFRLTPKQIAEGMETLLRITAASGAGVFGSPNVLLICPPHIGRETSFPEFSGVREKSKQLSAHYAGLAEKYGCRFFDAADIIHESDLPDGVHLDTRAHERLGLKAADIAGDILKQ